MYLLLSLFKLKRKQSCCVAVFVGTSVWWVQVRTWVMNSEEPGQNLAKATHQKAPREPGSCNNRLCVAVDKQQLLSSQNNKTTHFWLLTWEAGCYDLCKVLFGAIPLFLITLRTPVFQEQHTQQFCVFELVKTCLLLRKEMRLPAQIFRFIKGKIFWRSVPDDVYDRAANANVIKITPEITRFAVTRDRDVK